jgi:hypothetical protein
LSILRDLFRCPICALAIEFSPWHDGFSAACRSSIEAFSCQQALTPKQLLCYLFGLKADH